jgi:RimJ/RimL family protein N-acetyltransferase
MPETPTVLLRTRTDDDLDLLYAVAADLDTWEERNPWPPAPLTRERFDARLARAADGDAADANVTFVVDVDGTAVGSASLFEFDPFARHAEAGISLLPDARGRGIGTAAIGQLVEFGFVRRNLRRIHLQRSHRTPLRSVRLRRQGLWSRGGSASMRGSGAPTRTSS